MHGIDAWRDAEAGRAEMQELTAVTGQADRRRAGCTGCISPTDSPRTLESRRVRLRLDLGLQRRRRLPGGHLAGVPPAAERAAAGTAAVHHGLGDVLSAAGWISAHDDALERCGGIVANARRFGGTLVINWHDRSLAPERLWGRVYRTLLDEIGTGDRAWFATAGEAVDWFRWRRSIRFTRRQPVRRRDGRRVAAERATLLPAVIRIHRPRRRRRTRRGACVRRRGKPCGSRL